MKSDRFYVWVSFSFAVIGAAVSAHYGVGCFLIFNYVCLPFLLFILVRFFPFLAVVSEEKALKCLAWQRRVVVLILASLLMALATFWVRDFGWLDLSEFAKPIVPGKSIVNLITLRPVMDAELFMGRYTFAIYYLWAASASIHLCLVWRIEWKETHFLRARAVKIFFASIVAMVGLGGLVMVYGSTMRELDYSAGELLFIGMITTAAFAGMLFLSTYTNYFFAGFLQRAR